MIFPCKEGDRIRLLHMPEDPDPIPAGTTGTVTSVSPCSSWMRGELMVSVKWDIPRSLSMIYPIDKFEVMT